MQSFSAGACTWPKILLRLQVWNLFAIGEQIMRAADCKFCQKRARPFFDSFVHPAGLSMMIPFAMGRSYLAYSPAWRDAWMAARTAALASAMVPERVAPAAAR